MEGGLPVRRVGITENISRKANAAGQEASPPGSRGLRCVAVGVISVTPTRHGCSIWAGAAN
jgi:hypothetical protein